MVKQHIKKQVIISNEAEVLIVYYWLEFLSKLLQNIRNIISLKMCPSNNISIFTKNTPFIEDTHTCFFI